MELNQPMTTIFTEQDFPVGSTIYQISWFHKRPDKFNPQRQGYIYGKPTENYPSVFIYREGTIKETPPTSREPFITSLGSFYWSEFVRPHRILVPAFFWQAIKEGKGNTLPAHFHLMNKLTLFGQASLFDWVLKCELSEEQMLNQVKHY